MKRPQLSALLVLASAGCGAPIEEDVSAESSALGYSFSGCSSEERGLLDAALNRIDRTEFRTCLPDAILAWTDGVSATRAAAGIPVNQPLAKVACVASTFCNGTSTDAMACPGSGGAQVAIEHDAIWGSAARLAGVLAHAYAHDLGYTHPASNSPAYDHSLPRQMQRCVERGGSAMPPWLTRDELTNETELSPVGSADGVPASFDCPVGTHATGFTMTDNTTGARGLKVYCSDGTQGGIGATAFEHDGRCPVGDALVGLGIGENDNGNVTRLAPFCVSPDNIRSGANRPMTLWPTYLGTVEMDAASWSECPPYMVMTGVRGRQSTHLNRLSVVCKRIDARPQGVTHPLALAGSTGLTYDTERDICLGYGVMVGLWGRAGAEIDMLGGRCSPTAAGTGGALMTTAPASSRELHLLRAVGGPGGTAFNDYCPGYGAGQVLIGLRVASGARVQRIQGICADPGEWTNASSPVTRAYTPSRGGTGGPMQTYECPRGEYLVGTHTWADQSPPNTTPTVFGLRPLCRRIDYCAGVWTPDHVCLEIELP